MTKMKPDFKGFADEMISMAWDAEDIDGATIQYVAVKHSLLKEKCAKEPCGESCSCREYDFPLSCYRKTYK